jgi:hypothetical protein
MAARTYRLKIVREGREFEAQGDRAFVHEMLKRYGPEAPTPTQIGEGKGKKIHEKPVPLVSPTKGKSLSIRVHSTARPKKAYRY